MKKISIRHKVKRHLLSALLSGVFSDNEVKEIADIFIKDEKFSSDLGRSIIKLVEQLSHLEDTNELPSQKRADSFHSSFAEEMNELMKKAGVSQRELFGMLDEIAPGAATFYENKRWTTLRILNHFLSECSDVNHQQLSRALKKRFRSKQSENDSYLDLISKKIVN